MTDFDDADLPGIPFKALRAPWHDEPDVDIHQTDEHVVRQHRDYDDAKAGDGEAAVRLVDDTINPVVVKSLRQRTELEPVLLPVVAEESEGANAIPLALAQRLCWNWAGRWKRASSSPTWQPVPARMATTGSRSSRCSTGLSMCVSPSCWWMISSGKARPWRTCGVMSSIWVDGWWASRHLRVSRFRVGWHCVRKLWAN